MHLVNVLTRCTCIGEVRANASVPFFMVTNAFQAYVYVRYWEGKTSRNVVFPTIDPRNVPNELTRSLENSAWQTIEPH